MYHPRSKRCAAVVKDQLAMVACDAGQGFKYFCTNLRFWKFHLPVKNLTNFKPLKLDDLQQVWSWQFVNQTQLEVFNSNPERSVRDDWEVKKKVQKTYLNTSCPHFLFTYLKRCSHLLSFKPRYKDTKRFINKKSHFNRKKLDLIFMRNWQIFECLKFCWISSDLSKIRTKWESYF